MAQTGNNLVGEPLDKFVYDEIQSRQTNQYQGLEQNSLRSESQHQYLNNTNSWVKIASSVEVGVDNKKTESNEETLGTERLKSVGLNPTNFLGTELAKKFIIFNGVSEVGKPNVRAGIADNTKLWNSDHAYGLGGTEFGLQPMPGIQSIDIKSLNRGSIRRATIELKAYNKFQFEIIELLYLRIGFHIMLEWGNDKFYNHDTSTIENLQNTIIEDSWFDKDNTTQLEMIRKIHAYRAIYSGNYDGFFGRVVNYNWSFEKDGSYNISIELATVGDVVESLNVNLPASITDKVKLKGGRTTGEEKQLTEDLDNLLDEWLYSQKALSIIASSGSTNTADDTPDYFNFQDNELYSDEERDKALEDHGELPFDKYTDYVRLGEFLKCLEDWVIPIQKGDGNLNGEPQILLNYDDFQFVSISPNQISLDPKICLIRPKEFSGKETAGIFYPTYLKKLLPYHVQKGDIEAGRVMNIYLNFNFITSTLKKHINNKGELPLYRYIQAICDGINVALGHVNNLEPILKEDKILNIIDQNLIPGVIEDMEEKNKEAIVPIEIYGYNKVSKQSTFVTDITFNTSITPDLGAMMTIGATAGGSTVKGTDATAFSKWNAGLQDRFNRDLEYADPEFSPINPVALRQAREDAKAHFEQVTTFPKIGRYLKALFSFGYNLIVVGHSVGKEAYKDKEGEVKEVWEKNGIPKGNYTLAQYMNVAENKYRQDARQKQTKNILQDQARYLSYLGNAFGGTRAIQTGDFKFHKPPSQKDSKYLKFDDAFISKGRTVYKSYLSDLNDRAYKKKEKEAKKIKDLYSSTQNGFIPIKLGITLRGISGIKIYNKLSIDQSFLPDNYPDSIHFIITNVDHRVENNQWVTVLDTMSVPKTDPKEIYKLEPLEFQGELTNYDRFEGVVPIGERGPKFFGEPLNKDFSYIEGRSQDQTRFSIRGKGNSTHKESILREIHPEVRENFKAFLDHLERDYKGWYMRINSTGRTIKKSKELKATNRANAVPGRSGHNYHTSIDCNIYGRVPGNPVSLVKKGNAADWVNSGIPDVAQQYGILWGGNFKNYEDNVHFYFNLEQANTDISVLYLELHKRVGNIAPEGVPLSQMKLNLEDVDPFDVPIYRNV